MEFLNQGAAVAAIPLLIVMMTLVESFAVAVVVAISLAGLALAVMGTLAVWFGHRS